MIHDDEELVALSSSAPEYQQFAKSKGKPDVKYSKIQETAITLISDEKQCSLFCGGKKCKYCGHKHWRSDQMAISGLFSHWVTEKVLAMSRPGKSAIKKFNLIDQFKRAGISSVINLQTPGEHAACGQGLESSGFSYDPQLFMDNDIFCYNFAWKDYGATSVSRILDIVKVMEFCLTQGKLAVHCHAGLGRTGVLIACFIVFSYRLSPFDAIHFLRKKRPGCIQTRGQMKRVLDFCRYLQPLRIIFTSCVRNATEVTLKQQLSRQSQILHGLEARELKYLPKIVYVICERLLTLSNLSKSAVPQSGTKSLSAVNFSNESSHQLLKFQGKNFKTSKRVSVSDTNLAKLSDSRVMSGSDLDNGSKIRDDLDLSSVKLAANSYEGKRSLRLQQITEQTEQDYLDAVSEISSGVDEDVIDIDDVGTVDASPCGSSTDTREENSAIVSNSNESIVSQKTELVDRVITERFSSISLVPETIKPETIVNTSSDTRNKLDHDTETISKSGQNVTSADTYSFADDSRIYSNHKKLTVIWSLSLQSFSEAVSSRALEYEKYLNVSSHAWTELQLESDPIVLCCILWQWFDTLKDPVLTVQDLILILDRSCDPISGLNQLERGTRATIKYIVKVVRKFYPIPTSLHIKVLENLFSHLTHQRVRMSVKDEGNIVSSSTTIKKTTGLPSYPHSTSTQWVYVDHSMSWSLMRASLVHKLFSFFNDVLNSSDLDAEYNSWPCHR